MGAMTDPDGPPEPASTPVPGERRLARPPSERYREAEAIAAAAAPPRSVSPARGLIAALLVAIAGAALIVLVGGVFALTIGLIVVAGAMGWLVALVLGLWAGSTLSPSRRAWSAAAIALGGVLLGQVGLWLYASSEGGVLSLPDYLGEVYGPLVPVQLVIAPVIAWITAR
jgi:hypothetical protein